MGLLILRLAVGFSLLGVTYMTDALAEATALLVRCGVVAVAALLWIGLWTPVAAVIEAVIQVGIMSLTQGFNTWSLVNAAAGLALAMLGPGCWSLDSRLFGRKRIV
jgi:putative oxidoreductase